MPKLSTVSVTFGRKIQTRPYESADASTTLTFQYDHDEEVNDLDTEISDAFDRAVAHVEATLGYEREHVEKKAAPPKQQAPKKDPAPEVTKTEEKKATPPKPKATKPATEEKKATPPKPKATKPAPAEPETEAEEVEYTKADLMKAISNTMTNLAKAGRSDGSELVQELVRKYLTEDKKPYSYTNIPEHSYVDFIRDLKELA